jgi:hypothetical protein
MDKKFDRLIVAALCSLTITGCLSEDPTCDPEATTAESSAELQVAAGNSHVVRNKLYNQCLTAPGNTLNGTLYLATCSFTSTQTWQFVQLPTPTYPPNTFFLLNSASGLCAEVNNGTANPGERVDQWTCNGQASEQWVAITRNVGGVPYQQYQHLGTNECLDTVGGRDSQMMQWTCGAANDAQTWFVQL